MTKEKLEEIEAFLSQFPPDEYSSRGPTAVTHLRTVMAEIAKLQAVVQAARNTVSDRVIKLPRWMSGEEVKGIIDWLDSLELREVEELKRVHERVAELERQLFAAQSDILREGMERDQAQAECARLKNIEAIAVRATEWACECQGEAMRYRQALEYCACEGQDDADIHAMDQFKLAEILIGIRNCAQSALSGEEERKG